MNSQIDEYLTEQDFSQRTITDYRCDLKAFYAFSDGKDPDVSLVRGWKKELESRGCGESHISRSMYALKGYCKWLGLDIFTNSREKNREKVRVPNMSFRDPPPTRSTDEVERMLKACQNPRETMLLMLLSTTGARIGELMKVNIKEDIDWESGTVSLVRKGRRGRKQKVSLSENTIKAMQDYLKWRNTKSNLLLPYTYDRLYKEFKSLAGRAKVEFPRGSLFHNLRHFFVLFQKEAGTDMRVISLAAGHSSSYITDRIYGALTPESIKGQLHAMPWESKR